MSRRCFNLDCSCSIGATCQVRRILPYLFYVLCIVERAHGPNLEAVRVLKQTVLPACIFPSTCKAHTCEATIRHQSYLHAVSAVRIIPALGVCYENLVSLKRSVATSMPNATCLWSLATLSSGLRSRANHHCHSQPRQLTPPRPLYRRCSHSGFPHSRH